MAVAIYDAVQTGNTLPANIMVLIISATAIGILYVTIRLQGARLI
jgi:ABC-type molybdate transport system permease subunit